MKIFEKLNLRHFINKCFRFDKRKFVRYSRSLTTNGQAHTLSQIALDTHVVEKGLTMPEMRPGFGQEVVRRLIGNCRSWSNSSDTADPFYIQAIKTVKEYHQTHNILGFVFDEPFRSEIESFVNANDSIPASEQLVFEGSDQFFYNAGEPFPEFALSRHSVRNFSDKDIPIERLTEAIQLAQCAPSSCNRQSTRVHIITDKTQISSLLAIQNGNRGFGHLVNKLLVITYSIPVYGSVKERNLGYIDSGIFTMNMLYALHYYRIGACTLNWCDSPKDDARLRSIIHIPDNETISLFIACGIVPDKQFKVPVSQRIEGSTITKIH